MRYVLLLGIALLGLLLQSTLFVHISIAGVRPDIVLVLAVFYSIFEGPKKGALFGFVVGLLQDIYLGRLIGMNALSKGLTAVITGWTATGAFSQNLLVPFVSLFFGTLFEQFVFLTVGKITGLPWSWSFFVWKGLPLAIYNACLVPFFYTPFYFWFTNNKEKTQNKLFEEKGVPYR